jgi:DNA-binding response OmpR family regulator
VPPQPLVVQLNIDLSRNPEAFTALTEALHAVVNPPSTPDSPDDRLRIVAPSRSVLRRGVPITPTRLEFDLLRYLAERPGLVLRRGTLMADVWGVDEPMGSRTVDVHIRRLRDKLGADHTLITTVRGVGYRFDGAGRVVVEPALP